MTCVKRQTDIKIVACFGFEVPNLTLESSIRVLQNKRDVTGKPHFIF